MGPYRQPAPREAVPLWLRRADGRFISLDQGIERVVGTDRGCDIVMDHGSVAARHATLTAGVARVLVRDLGGPSGTYVNDARVVGAAELRVLDHIRFGGAAACTIAQGHDLEATRRAARAQPKKCMYFGDAMSGSLQDMPLTDLLGMCAATRKTGSIAVVGPYAGDGATIGVRQGVVHRVFVRGAIVEDPVVTRALIEEISAWRDARYSFMPRPATVR